MFRRAAHGLGIAIDNAARAVYRKALGLRIPAARIRMADIEADRDFCAQRLEDACADVSYWKGQLDCAEKALQQAEWEHSRLLHGLDKTLKQRKEFS